MPIGEFAKNKINIMFEKVRNIKTTENELYNGIRLVGESLLRSQLLLAGFTPAFTFSVCRRTGDAPVNRP